MKSFSFSQLDEAKKYIKETIKLGLFNYVYLFKRLDKTSINDFEIFYVGEGSKNRFLQHFYPKQLEKKHPKNSILKKLDKNQIKIEFVDFFDSKYKALELEEFLISFIGRKDLHTGTLTNLSNGGPETNRGHSKGMSEETKKKISETLKGRKRPFHVGEAVRESNKKRIVSDITRKRISLANTGKKRSLETKLKMSLAQKGHPFYKGFTGYHHSEESKIMISESKLKRTYMKQIGELRR